MSHSALPTQMIKATLKGKCTGTDLRTSHRAGSRHTGARRSIDYFYASYVRNPSRMDRGN